jgi:hypothetical protein
MHLEMQLTLATRDKEGTVDKDNIIDYVAGYTLAVSSRIRPAGDTSDHGPEYDGRSL